MRTVFIILTTCFIGLALIVVREEMVEDICVGRSEALVRDQMEIKSEIISSFERIFDLRTVLDSLLEQALKDKRSVEGLVGLRCQLQGEIKHLCDALNKGANEIPPSGKWLPFWMNDTRALQFMDNISCATEIIAARIALKSILKESLTDLEALDRESRKETEI